MKITDLETLIPDTSAKDFADSVVEQLELLRDSLTIGGREGFDQGKREMLVEIIGYLKYVKP